MTLPARQNKRINERTVFEAAIFINITTIISAAVFQLFSGKNFVIITRSICL